MQIDPIVIAGDDLNRQHRLIPKDVSALRISEEMFSYIVPNVTLSLHAVGAVYQIGWEQNCGCNGQKPPVFNELVARRDNHILAWHRWKKEQKRDHSRRLRELQRQGDIDAAAFRKATQEKERAAITAQRAEQKRQTTLETEQDRKSVV